MTEWGDRSMENILIYFNFLFCTFYFNKKLEIKCSVGVFK